MLATSLLSSADTTAWGFYGEERAAEAEAEAQIGAKAFSNVSNNFQLKTNPASWDSEYVVGIEMVSTIEALMYAIARVRADLGPSDMRDKQLVVIKMGVAMQVSNYLRNFKGLGFIQLQNDVFINELGGLSKYFMRLQKTKLATPKINFVFGTYDDPKQFQERLASDFPLKTTLKQKLQGTIDIWRGKQIKQELNYAVELQKIAAVMLVVGGEHESPKAPAAPRYDFVYTYLNLTLAFYYLLDGNANQAERFFAEAKLAAAHGVQAESLKYQFNDANLLPSPPMNRHALE
jgi:hypothetical protein